MSAIQALLTEHIDIWTAADTAKKSGRGRSSGNAGSVYGIKKLRELILELAVRGKLVPQDASDEPASALLKRIQAEKAKLIAEGKIKKYKPLAVISDEEKPFVLPLGWDWARLGFIGNTQTGATPSKSSAESFGSDIPFVKPGDIYPNHVEYSNEGLSFYGAKQSGRIAQAGSLLMVCIGTIGKCNLIERDCSFNQQINSVTPYLFDSSYLLSVCRSIYFYTEAWSRSSSTTIAILNKGNWEEICIPIPPLAEQHRIVAKVDELMALCDQLEARHNNALEAHEKLVSHLLATLTQSQSAEDFEDNWQRIAAHFDTLFTSEASIETLKQTLLQLAVMGKLVPQDPNDEPASALLKRIQAEKAKLVAEGKIKKDKPLPPITEEEKLFELPQGWEFVRKAEVFSFLNGYAFKSEWFESSGVKLLRNVNVSHGVANWEEVAHVSTGHAAEFKEYELIVGDIVLSLDRPIITTGLKYALISNSDIPCLLLQRVAKISSFAKSVTSEYLALWLNSSFFVGNIDPGRSNGVPHISTTQVSNMVFSLPPLSEQHRIVAKVDELMALCDRLKTRITDARQLQQKLADVMVERAIA